jgi:hypothetical protein
MGEGGVRVCESLPHPFAELGLVAMAQQQHGLLCCLDVLLAPGPQGRAVLLSRQRKTGERGRREEGWKV